MLCDHGCKYNKLKFFLYDLNILWIKINMKYVNTYNYIYYTL